MAAEHARRARSRGFGLVEVMVSILIFSIGLLGMAALQAKASKLSVEAEDRSRAALLASELVSQMWLGRTLSLSEESVAAWRARVRDRAVSGLAAADGAVSVAVVDGLRVATVTIRWTPAVHGAAQAQGVYATQVAMP